MTTAERVVITGIGAVSSLGLGVENLFAGALLGKSAVRDCSADGKRWIAAPVPAQVTTGETRQLPANADRHVGLACLAVGEAIADAGLEQMSAQDLEQSGVYWGTGVGSAASVEESYARLHAAQRLRPLTILLAMQNAAVAQIAMDFGLRGPQLSVSQACASAAAAIGEAMLALRHGRADRIVVGGSDAPLVPGQMLAWEALRVLAKPDATDLARSCRPFDRNRSGLVLGEGAAALVLERESIARQRNARIYAQLCGYGNVGDAGHYAQPDPDGQRRAMEMALRDAALAPRDIGYINAHATGTTVGDRSEATAIRSVFGEGSTPAVSSTKGAHGHTLGAAGALELAISVLALQRGELPPTTHLEEPDVDGIDLIMGTSRKVDIDAVLSNTFAFGGSNVCLVVRRLHQSA